MSDKNWEASTAINDDCRRGRDLCDVISTALRATQYDPAVVGGHGDWLLAGTVGHVRTLLEEVAAAVGVSIGPKLDADTEARR